jgi:hypothetical protein
VLDFMQPDRAGGELCGNLGDDVWLKAAYRGGCQSLPEPPERSDTPCREIPLSLPSVSLTTSTIH